MSLQDSLNHLSDAINQSGIDVSNIHDAADLASVLDDLGDRFGLDTSFLTPDHMVYLTERLHHLDNWSAGMAGQHAAEGTAQTSVAAATAVGTTALFFSQAIRDAFAEAIKEAAKAIGKEGTEAGMKFFGKIRDKWMKRSTP